MPETVSETACGETGLSDLRDYGRRIVSEAGAMLDVLCEAARETAGQFRVGGPYEASANLYNLLDSLQRFLFCLSQVKGACLPDQPRSTLNEPEAERLSAALDAMRACQEGGRWQELAGRIESDLLPALKGLHGALADLRGAL
jgi:hypothetical protein